MNDLASRLISENRSRRSPFLDLGNCGLDTIPLELAQHTWLLSLSFGAEMREWLNGSWHVRKCTNGGEPNQLRNVDIVANLTLLEGLYLSGNPVSDLSPLLSCQNLRWLGLNRTRVVDLHPLSNLASLEYLDITDSQVRDLGPLSQLAEMKEFLAIGTRIKQIDPLAEWKSLQRISLAGTLVVDVSALGHLRALKSVDLTGTNVGDISFISTLTSLHELILARTHISDFKSLLLTSSVAVLDLSMSNICELSALANLDRLVRLNVSHTSVACLMPLAAHGKLQSLNFSSTGVDNINVVERMVDLRILDASGTQVKSILALAAASQLVKINISNTKITDLTPLSSSIFLSIIEAAGAPLSDLGPLAMLSSLFYLNLEKTNVSNVSSLATLAKLNYLNLSDTKVRDIFPIRHLIERDIPVIVTHRDISDDLGRLIRNTQFLNGYCLDLKGCPLSTPPVEIVAQGNAAILNFFDELESDEKDFLYEAKMLILGEGGAGKTSLFRRLYQPNLPLPLEEETTKGISIYRHEFMLKNGRQFRLNVWDFGGQEIYHATHQFFLTQRSLYLLLDDTRKDNKSVSDAGFTYWLDMIDVLSEHSPVLIFQNEKGGRSKAIDLAGIKSKYPNVKEKYAGNLENPHSVEKFRHGVEFFANSLEHIGEQLPAKWLRVRSDIEARTEQVSHISISEYFEIYQRHIKFDREKALHLSRYLHDLGVFLHFQHDDLLARTLILRNGWATEAVFRMLDDEEIKGSLGRFTAQDCARLWKDDEYIDMHPELLALMQRFELCYLLPDSRPKTWLAPQLLPPTKHRLLIDWGKTNDLVIRYHYDFMPKGLISRLMVRLHRFVANPECAYVTGVLFERDQTYAFVELLPSGMEIEVRCRGVERAALLSVVCSDLDALNSSFHGLVNKVEKRIPCICPKCITDTVPEFFAQRNLLKRMEDMRLTIECPSSYEYVNVQELLAGVTGDVPKEWSLPVPRVALKKVKIFLASSSELREERDAFDLHFRQLNDHLIEIGVYLEIVRWENFLDAVSDVRLQNEYNAAVRRADIFVSLFATKTGKYTEEEFNVAHEQFIASGAPKIFTFFKDAVITTGSMREGDVISLLNFKRKLKDLGHFATEFKNTADLQLKFTNQLRQLKSIS